MKDIIAVLLLFIVVVSSEDTCNSGTDCPNGYCCSKNSSVTSCMPFLEQEDRCSDPKQDKKTKVYKGQCPCGTDLVCANRRKFFCNGYKGRNNCKLPGKSCQVPPKKNPGTVVDTCYLKIFPYPCINNESLWDQYCVNSDCPEKQNTTCGNHLHYGDILCEDKDKICVVPYPSFAQISHDNAKCQPRSKVGEPCYLFHSKDRDPRLQTYAAFPACEEGLTCDKANYTKGFYQYIGKCYCRDEKCKTQTVEDCNYFKRFNLPLPPICLSVSVNVSSNGQVNGNGNVNGMKTSGQANPNMIPGAGRMQMMTSG